MRTLTSRTRFLIYLGFGVFGINFALAIHDSTHLNFLVNELNIQAFEVGAIESIREIPGLLSVLILGSILQFHEPMLAGSFLLIFGLGIGGVSTVKDWIQAGAWAFLWSIGFHSWSPLSTSITLSLSDLKSEGRRLGHMQSVASIAAMIAMASVIIFSTFFVMQYRLFFIIAGIVSVLGGLMVFKIRSRSSFKTTRFVFRRQYTIYYILNLLEGARRQIFLTFAPFALVKVYGLDVSMIALLMFSSSFLLFLASPFLGKLVDKVGHKKMLTISYILMIGVFLGYAYIRNVPVLLLLYILNSILMISSVISRTTYINSIASVTDLTSSLAMGQTMDHISAVILPVTAGFFWGIFGYEATFFVGVAIALGLLLATQGIGLKTHIHPTLINDVNE